MGLVWQDLIGFNQENKGLNTAIVGGEIISSQEKLANEYSKSFLDKINEIKNEMPTNNILAEKIDTNFIPRVEETLKISEVTKKMY